MDLFWRVEKLLKLISSVEQKKIEIFLRKILDALRIKHFVYRMLIVPNQKIALRRLRKIINNSPAIENKYSGKKVLFNSVDGRYMQTTYIEGAIAKSLQMRGHKVKMLICGGALNMCTTFHRIDHPPNRWSCKNCISFSKKFYETTGLPYSTYDEYLKHKKGLTSIKNKVEEMPIEECEKLIYKGVKVGNHAKTSAKRYFRGGEPPEDKFELILRYELMNAIISTDTAEELLKKEKPDVLVTTHGCYSSWGSITDYFRNQGIRVCVWGGGYKDDIRFDRYKWNFKKYYEEVRKKRLLDEEEKKDLACFLDKREEGSEGQIALYNYSDTDKEQLEKQFNFNKYDKTYVMFPNVPWDAALLSADVAFKNVYDWISNTIEFFEDKPKLQLIIKIHPSEIRVMESKRTLLDYINSKFPSLPENIKTIPPDTKISPYSLFPFIDVGIIYNGTAGLEMSIQGIPVIVAGAALYRNKGFTYDINKKEEYSEVLSKDISTLPNQQNLAKLYAYFYFIKSFVPHDFIYYNSFLDMGWNINSLEEFNPGNNKHLDRICDYIINDGIFQYW